LTALLERLGISRPLLLDAAMGTALIERGLEPHAERAPTWSLVHPREVSAIHAAHVTAGAELLLANTFSETAPTPQEAAASIRLARAEGPRFVAGSLWADLTPAEVEKAVRALGAADAIWLETGTDMERARAAVEAACAVSAQPVVATLAFTQLASPGWEQALTALADAGAAAVGFNCAPCPPEPGALVQAPSNLTGICDRSIQSNIDAALNGTKNINDVITAVEPRLWNMSTVLPILQDTTIVAAGPSVQNVSLSGAVPVGIVGDAGQWVKTGP